MRKAFLILILGALLGSNPSTAFAKTIFADGFESGSLDRGNDWFAWHGTGTDAGDSVRVTENNPHSGSHSVEFTAGGGSGDAWIELNFRFPEPRKEVWLRWYQYYPDGSEANLDTAAYYHRDTPDSPDNNKFLLIGNPEAPRYESGSYAIFGFETNHGGPFGMPNDGRSYIMPKYRPRGGLFGRYGNTWVNGGEVQNESIRGRWVECVAHFKVASGFGNEDGVAQLWVDGTLIANETSLDGWPKDADAEEGHLNIFTGGYIMGYMNSGFDQKTKTWIDEFEVSSSPFGPEAPPSVPTDVEAN